MYSHPNLLYAECPDADISQMPVGVSILQSWPECRIRKIQHQLIMLNVSLLHLKWKLSKIKEILLKIIRVVS